jgi:SAM-dependent methyltransferase
MPEMDQLTLGAYDTNAADFARDWNAQAAPEDLYGLLTRFFRPGRTADIGCGSGRDVAWLTANGFPATGYDPSAGLLAQARAGYPGLTFHCAALPELSDVPDGAFENALCETVLMHLRRDAIAPAVSRLMAILKPGGTLYLSWRIGAGTDQRDAHGRLYSVVDAQLVRAALSGAELLLDAQGVNASSGKPVHRVVARKKMGTEAGGR